MFLIKHAEPSFWGTTIVTRPFRVSTGLKDLIGQGLITNDYVAVFELVKNSFDAHARFVRIVFLTDKIIIADDGKGMSRQDVIEKWLFVAYSAKNDGTEDLDYRHDIGKRRRHAYAGAKGVGRFSCDRLGQTLTLHSRAEGHMVQVLNVDWTLYEQDAKREFGEIGVFLEQQPEFADSIAKYAGPTSTILEIQGLRSTWDRDMLLGLRRELAKLINPFESDSNDFRIVIDAPSQVEQDRSIRENAKAKRAAAPQAETASLPLINGPITNTILDVLKEKTSSVQVNISADDVLTTRLNDRGEKVYETREPNDYPGLTNAGVEAEIYFLNRSAKQVFARRMGLPSVQFGSIFVFRNGFRVYPIGREDDDFFGLARRHQQGVRRFLGTRDLIGRVQIDGTEGFNETTSRDGLIRTPQVKQLIDCVRDKCVRRLERYVVDITWKDRYDKDQSDTSRMRLDDSSARITQLVSRMAGTKGVNLVDYNPDLVRIVDEKSAFFESSLKALELLAEATGDRALINKVDQANRRLRELEAAEAEARAAQARADEHVARLEKKIAQADERNRFLVAASSLDEDTILNLHHQILMLASDIQNGVRRMMGKLRRGSGIEKDDWIDFLEHVSYRNSQIVTAARFATKGGYRQQSAEIEADLAVYMVDYILNVASIWSPQGMKVSVDRSAAPFARTFRPIEIGIVIDNLVSNARRARASKVHFSIEVSARPHGELVIHVADNGTGWDNALQPLDSAMAKGVTTTDGSGLGLHHVKQVVEGLGGVLKPVKEPYSDDLTGAHLILRVPQ